MTMRSGGTVERVGCMTGCLQWSFTSDRKGPEMAERKGRKKFDESRVGGVRLVIEGGESEADQVGKVIGTFPYRSVRGARDALYVLREEWEGEGWVGDNNLTVYWREGAWRQGLVVDERGERI